jgi:hypothetical protein
MSKWRTTPAWPPLQEATVLHPTHLPFERRHKMMTAKRYLFTFVSALFLGAVLFAGAAWAADKTYQVTGPILEVTDTTITVQKGKEKWEIARTKDTKVTGDLKVGAKVTIAYTMTAASIEAKGDAKGDAKAEKAPKK